MFIRSILKKAFGSGKGPGTGVPSGFYRHYVGRHTQKFCLNGAHRAKNSEQKWLWLASAISADEVIATLAGLEDRRPLGALADWQPRPDGDTKSYLQALRTYLSGLLLLYGTCKEELLRRLEMPEQLFLKTWQAVFEYEEEDKTFFDATLAPAFRSQGIDGLAGAVGTRIRDALFPPDTPVSADARASLQELMLDDLAAMKRHLAKAEENQAASDRK